MDVHGLGWDIVLDTELDVLLGYVMDWFDHQTVLACFLVGSRVRFVVYYQ